MTVNSSAKNSGVGDAAAAILAFDIGTSSSRAVLYDAQTGSAIPGASHSIAHEQHSSPEGGATLDADALVSEAVACARAVLATPGRPQIVGVALCTFWHSFVGVDENGRARTPVLLWSDRRSAQQVQALREALDVAAYTERTGCPLHTSYLPGRLRWLAETDPHTFAACVRFVSPGEYLFAQVFGPERVTCSVSMASATGLLDQARGAWDGETLAHVPGFGPERLSPIGDQPVQGDLRPPFQSDFAALANVSWFPAYGDGACSNLGCGATTPNRLALMIGTSGALRVVAQESNGQQPPRVPAGLWRYQADARRFLLGGAISNGGIVWDWLEQTLRLPGLPPDKVDAAVAALFPDGHGLTVLPFLNGERAPSWRDDARAVIAGISASTTPLDIARAHLEAVAYRFALVRERLQSVAGTGAQLIGSGGGLHASPAWAQILADVLGEPILLSREEQASSRGAALLVRERLGLGRVDDFAPVVERRFEPNAGRAGVYQAARARHEKLEALLAL